MATRVISPDDPGWVDEAARVVRGGGVVALAYERLFGLAADALHPEAVAKVAKIKGRPAGERGPRPISVILPNRGALWTVAREVGPLAEKLMDRHWPGLVTVIVAAKDGLPAPLLGSGGLIGVRLPGPSPAFDLASRSGLVLTATSANRADAPDALSHEDVLSLEGVDLLVEGQVSGTPGSTVVDASAARPIVLRRGAVKIEEDLL